MVALFPLAGAEETVPEDAASAEGPSILLKSPFLPPDFQPPGTPGQAAGEQRQSGQYQFRGVYELGGVFHYNLYDAREKKGYWITQANAKQKGFDIVEFKPEENSLVLRVNGETQSLAMVETSNTPMQIQGSKPATLAKPGTAEVRRTPQTARRRVIRPANRASSPSPNAPQRRTINRTNPQNQNFHDRTRRDRNKTDPGRP